MGQGRERGSAGVGGTGRVGRIRLGGVGLMEVAREAQREGE